MNTLVPTPLTHTLAQVAALTGLSEAALRARIFRGQLQTVKWGRQVLVQASDVERIVGPR